MGKMMQSCTGDRNIAPIIQFAILRKEDERNESAAEIAFAEALEKGLIEMEQVEHYDGLPHVKIHNNSSWKIVIFSGSELIGKKRDRCVNITITLQHNASVVVPAYFLSSTYFFDQGMVSIQEYLHYFRLRDSQAGVVFRVNGRITGQRYGDFPLRVEVHYKWEFANCFHSFASII